MSILALYSHIDTSLKDSSNRTPLQRLIQFIAQGFTETEQQGIMSCLYAFLCAGANITEALVSQTVKDYQQPTVMNDIRNAILLKQSVENLVGHLGPDVVQHVLLQSPKERDAFLKENKKLKEKEEFPKETKFCNSLRLI